MYKTVRNTTMLGIGLSISAIVGWLLLKETRREKEPSSVTIKSQVRSPETDPVPQIVLPLEALEPDASTNDISDDDLTRINGIGPRFAEALTTIGVLSFTQLANQTPESLAEQLAVHVNITAQRIRDNDWIGQAAQLSES